MIVCSCNVLSDGDVKACLGPGPGCPRTPAGFAGGVALVYFAFFAFNKQAFENYYFFVIGALCCAVALTPEPRRHKV